MNYPPVCSLGEKINRFAKSGKFDEGEFLFALSLESTLTIHLYEIVNIQQSKHCKINKTSKRCQ